MIFITVGTQAPFDRLIKVMDEWAKNSGMECFAQIYNASYFPKYMPYQEMLSEKEYNEIFQKASIIVSHAGMGTIISALQNDKILLTLPRLAHFREHRNDHQMDTTRAFSEKGYIYPIFNEKDLLDHLKHINELHCLTHISRKANDTLLKFLKNL